MNTISAHPATTFRSLVGGNSPTSELRLENADSAMIVPISGPKSRKYGSMFSLTRLSDFSTIHSATSCRRVSGFAQIPCVRYRAKKKIVAITSHELICAAVIGSGWIGRSIVK